MRMNFLTAFFAALLLVSSTSEAQGRGSRRGGGIEEGRAAYTFELKRVEGKGTVSLADLQDRPVVLIFGSYT